MWWGGRWRGVQDGGTPIHPWLIHVNVWQKPLQYCKVINLQLKLKKKKKTIARGERLEPNVNSIFLKQKGQEVFKEFAREGAHWPVCVF